MEESRLNGQETLRVGISLWPLAYNGGGMRAYVLELIPWMVRLSKHHFQLYCGPAGWPSAALVPGRLNAVERRRLELISIDAEEEILRHAHRFDVFFCPLNSLAPRLLDRPTVATLADVQEQQFPEYFTTEQLQLRAALYPFTARSATVLLTISEFSKGAICAAFDVPPAKVRVTHLAPSDELLTTPPFWPADWPALPERFVFYPANLYPHKNHELLLAALSELNHRRRQPCAAVLTGHPTTPGIDVEALIARHRLTGLVRWYRQVPTAQLRHLYEQAAALVFPSRYEGFGMPLVEAQQLGCPVIASRAPWASEIVGAAGQLVDPTPNAFADAIAAVLADPARARSLAARGKASAERFSSRHTAHQTLSAVDDAVAHFDPPRASARVPMTFVVLPRTVGAALQRTLQSVAAARASGDAVLVLAAAERVSGSCRTGVENFEAGTFFESRGRRRPGAWLSEIDRPYVYVIREGDRICPGALQQAIETLTLRPECVAATGDVLSADDAGQYCGHTFVPLTTRERLLTAPVPASAVVWRTAFLAERPAVLQRLWWSNWRLLDAQDRVAVILRTLAASRSERPGVVRSLSRQVCAARESLALRRAFFPESSRARLLQNWIREFCWQHKARLGALARTLPPTWQHRLRFWYVRSGRQRLFPGNSS
jgi:glycosyltransferase involved in cell wall biosynthesis